MLDMHTTRTCYTKEGKPKRRFKNAREARRFLLERDIAYKQEPYACHACGWWHVRTST